MGKHCEDNPDAYRFAILDNATSKAAKTTDDFRAAWLTSVFSQLRVVDADVAKLIFIVGGGAGCQWERSSATYICQQLRKTGIDIHIWVKFVDLKMLKLANYDPDDVSHESDCLETKDMTENDFQMVRGWCNGESYCRY